MGVGISYPKESEEDNGGSMAERGGLHNQLRRRERKP